MRIDVRFLEKDPFLFCFESVKRLILGKESGKTDGLYKIKKIAILKKMFDKRGEKNDLLCGR